MSCRLNADFGRVAAPWVLAMAAAAAALAAASDSPVLPYKDAKRPVAERVADLLARMSLDEKVGQMTQADHSFLKADEDVARLFLGSVLSGGDSEVGGNTPKEWADLYDRLQRQALQTRLGIPLIYGVDAVHGHNNVKGAVVFPHNIGMGATRNPKLVEQAARITAIEVAATGIDWTFAPCITVPRDERWGRTYEGFGETAELATLLGPPAVRGFQGKDLSDATSILACPKHYVGDGGTRDGVDRGDMTVDEPVLRKVHLPGYEAAVKAGAGSVMASFSSWNGEKMHGHKKLLTDVLRGELGFEGLIVSDWQAIDELPGDYDSDVERSVNAGIDMVMVPEHYARFFATLKTAVEKGRVPMARVDDAVRRILAAKFKLGLFERPLADRSLLPKVGSPEHRAVARQAVRESLVLLKNEGRALPLSKQAGPIVVAGTAADDIGRQCGGWTISWQGAPGAITDGTTALAAIRNAAGAAAVAHWKSGRVADGAKVAVVVAGETPYAEMKGDRPSLDLDPADVEAVRSLKQAGLKVVVVVVSGRPMILEPVLPHADAVVAAWLPGSEGDGVADVLFGSWSPTGKLGHSWPKSMAQIPVNVDRLGPDTRAEPLFAYGFGLTY
jgi:beta-glucosidase